MDIKKLIDHIMKTPSNSNPAVLKSLLEDLSESVGEITDATASEGDIKKGKIAYNNFGKITGTFEPLDTSDATAAAGDILASKTAYVNGSKVTGTAVAQEAKTFTPTTSDQTIAAGTHLTGIVTIKGDSNLISANIKNGVTIFGVSGNTNVIDTTEASNAVTAEEIPLGKVAFVNGQKIVGTKPAA